MRFERKVQLVNFCIQLTGWTLFTVLPVIYTPEITRSAASTGQYIVQHVLLAALFYINYFFLQQIIRKKGTAFYLLFAVFLMVAFFFLVHLFDLFFTGGGLNLRFGMLAPILQVYAFSVAFRFLADYVIDAQRRRQLEEERRMAELGFLRSQINPHFLFNTLNNINAMIRIAPDAAEESIGLLSEIMRYMLNSGNKGKVQLAEELNYLDSYVALQRLRLSSKVNFRYAVSGNPSGLEIEPLIMISYIENAFKHFYSPDKENYIHISVSVQPDKVLLEVENSRSLQAKAGEIVSGVGLQNAERRLQLLYPGRHRLVIRDDAERYYVKLELELR